MKIKKINNEAWKNIKEVKRIFKAFGNDKIFFVGGVVRNSILREKIGDIDLATKINFKDSKSLLQTKGFKFYDLSTGHGTISIFFKNTTLEITSMRIDKKTYGRRAEVEFTGDIYLDSCRRDFSINAIYSSFDGEIYDPQKGLKDLKLKKVRFIGDPKKRINEDNLRILRYFRFLSYYGCQKSRIDKGSMLACKNLSYLIASISKERKSMEFYKIINAKYASNILLILKEENILNSIIPGLESIKNSDLKLFNKLVQDKLLRVSFLLIQANIKIDNIKKHLIFNKEEYNIIKIIYCNVNVVSLKTLEDIKKIKYKFGADIGFKIFYLQSFLKNTTLSPRFNSFLKNWVVPKFPISGHDLKKIGLRSGKDMGEILKEIEKWWIIEGFYPKKKQCLERVKILFSNSIKP